MSRLANAILHWRNLYVFLWISSSAWLIQSLRLTETVIPYYGVLNGQALLHCFFDLENASLFSVKWYKDGHEFFRYKPKHEPHITVFPLNGVTVNENKSSMNHVMLEPVSLLSKGVYRCEVSADAPSFQTVHEDHSMNVMVLPRLGPQLTGVLPWYNIGDNLTAKCSVEKSFPQARLTWFVNDVQLDAEVCECISYETSESGRAIDGTVFYSSTTQLEFQLDTPYFRDGSMVVECKATFNKSPVVIRNKAQSNVKAGFGRHYANIFSSATRTSTSLSSAVCRIVVLSCFIYFIRINFVCTEVVL